MAPIRRYLRISRHSVLECRIFLENPADRDRWLLNPQDRALDRIFDAVKPYVLPKLREENERVKGKGKKKKSVKDVVRQDDFEISIFLTEVGTRHALIIKNKTFQQREPIKSNSSKMLGAAGGPVTIHEESDEEDVSMGDIPAAINVEDDGSGEDQTTRYPSGRDGATGSDDKKKMGFTTSYDGFNIWGLVLCLLVERKGGSIKKPQNVPAGNAQALMEEWISTQREQIDD
ncbi:uncharacterized protein HMPREF1541_06838 [Cyphellophora europaea CBS 101466]|uniref:Uncharacterized protein n=1 Tax=Cyphellophora europaea (strain CBS 101466) TaxID=1220924 RepID=W2RSU9_CYPE1|nr:uncharacterized protein HMPREF1541_06838 [Cyphellophora europaea CBS 101466]ETN38799.1 hypothetical protein HMPREF1541_06838 [Cyphellophora europaea CBS 101466]